MADVVYTPQEIVEVYIVNTISNLDAPTVTELNAGTRLTDFITDGPPAPAGSNFVPAGTLASGFESQAASTYGGGSGAMTILNKRDTTTTDATADDAYSALPRGTVTNLVVAAYGVTTGTTFSAGDVVSIYPIEVANRSRQITRGQLVASTIDVAFNDLPHENVVVTT